MNAGFIKYKAKTVASFIPTNFDAMRADFIAAAQKAGASLEQIIHPLHGPTGEQLSTDVALIGRRDARRMLVILSGTHGAEAAFGSACQSRWVGSTDLAGLPEDLAILLIHAINPWGAAWMRRVTENNVDLNRNFIDWSKEPPRNENYRRVHEVAAFTAWDGQEREQARQAYARLQQELGGPQAMVAVVEAGQYEFSDGLYYGGSQAEWSNLTLHRIMQDHVSEAENVVLFDLHTGAGPYGYPALLSIAESEHGGLDWGRTIYGPAMSVVLTGTNATTDTGIAATATGYVSAAVRKMLPRAKLLPLVVECGTLAPGVMAEAVSADNWLHLHGDPASPLGLDIKQRLRTGFIPEDRAWEEACIPASLRYFDRALQSLHDLAAQNPLPARVAANVVPPMAAELLPPAVEVHDLHKSFGSLAVLGGVNLVARPGEVVSMIGSSGSGKSTFLRCVNLLEQPDSGRIVIDGEEIAIRRRRDGKQAPANKRQVERIRADVGMVFQNFNLWPHMTVLENIIEAPVHVRSQHRADAVDHAHELLRKVGLAEKHGHYPAQLSGGQQQRAAIARTLAMRPKVILLDEPTSALDPELVGEVLRVIRQLAEEGNTMILVTHEMSFAYEVSHKILFLHQGRVEEQGAPTTLFSNPQSPRLRQFLARTFIN
ncbi:DUF2817 domain-containing protein [Ochrobactrum sp. WV_118_8]|nr:MULTISPECIES: DUF2817 domain-containing protein [Brucella]